MMAEIEGFDWLANVIEMVKICTLENASAVL